MTQPVVQATGPRQLGMERRRWPVSRRIGWTAIYCIGPANTLLEETIAAFEELQGEGKILAWGVSNFDVADLEQAYALAGAGRIACTQVLYHLKQRAVVHDVIPWCEAHDVAVVAYSPFGSGRFPGSSTSEARVLQEVAGAHGATARQVALRFLVRRPSLFAVPRTARPDHAAENAGAGALRLTDEELDRIGDAFPLGRRPRELPTL